MTLNFQQPVEKCYFLSVAKVSYGRETSMPNPVSTYSGSRSVNKDDTPTHKLVVLLLKGAWTPSNRDIILALYDSFRKTQVLLSRGFVVMVDLYRKLFSRKQC